MENDTICAISTPIGTGGISIVRLSGSKAKEIAFKLFSCKQCDVKSVTPRYFYLGHISHKDLNEQCMLVFFQSPHSYTGEDLIEIQCHGGILVTRKILEYMTQCGARLAEAGEFTKRAFVNGKVSLDEAEGIIDVINAESESELKAGYSIASGKLKTTVEKFQNTITDLLSEINVAFDFPENDDEDITASNALNKLRTLSTQLQNIIDTYQTGIKIKEGTRVVIVGKPNVGKSSLMNAMLGSERAIVTDIQGTTRDTIEETYTFNGVRFVLTDTAGLRETTDVIENIGIKKAKQSLNSADVVLFVIDNTFDLKSEEYDIIKNLSDKKVLIVVNKSDLNKKPDLNGLPFKNIIFCSAKKQDNIQAIKQRIYDMVIDGEVLKQNLIITSTRHKAALQKALDILKHVIFDLESGVDLDCISVQLQEGWETLGLITGVSQPEEIVSNIFSKFCVGK